MCLLQKKPATQQLQHNNMVLSGTLSAVLLCSLSLCLRGTETVDVDQNALARIISKLQKEYCPKQGDQFAVAINVPARYCSAGSNLDDGSFLKNDKPDAAKRDMNGVNKLYQGKELIGASRKSGNKKGFFHSEYLLLREPDPEHSPMKNLLNKNKDGCVIFYTYNSPCIGTCLYEEGDSNILDALYIFTGHQGPKAFVYNRIFKRDRTNYDLKEYLKKINEVPLYRCYPVHKPDHSPMPGHSRDRDRSPQPGHSHDRDRSRSPLSRSSDSDPYECHACIRLGEVAEQCIDINV
ncbi:uncharacterized protein LOC108410424 [Pygocentrus nattereri]|uniref:uncharacterized protein LOC108410424 n=1 Tax=Pygocentrus nattereri TaxID=42514 RepID=UPI001890F784|nr:uncharacterized protein LOC108410424 [Pygocentrus nattereri]